MCIYIHTYICILFMLAVQRRKSRQTIAHDFDQGVLSEQVWRFRLVACCVIVQVLTCHERVKEARVARERDAGRLFMLTPSWSGSHHVRRPATCGWPRAPNRCMLGFRSRRCCTCLHPADVQSRCKSCQQPGSDALVRTAAWHQRGLA